MRINSNIPALQTYNSIRQANRATQSSMLRLSTGYRINSAKEDAAGLAISNKMRMQINGLEMAGRNALDGVSLVQTADGALSEVHNMIQRMRELAVKAANGTLEDLDRAKIQMEVDSLLSEIDEISNRTEFNTIKLFGPKANGAGGFTFFNQTGLSNANEVNKVVKGASADPDFPDGNFEFELTKAGTPTSVDITVPAGATLAGKTFNMGSKTILFDENETNITALSKIESMAKELGYEVRALGASDTITVFSQGAIDLTYTPDVITIPEVGTDPATGIKYSRTDGEEAAITGAKFTLASGQVINILDITYQDNQITFTLDNPYKGKMATVQVDLIIDGGGNFVMNDEERDSSGNIITLATAVSATGDLPSGKTYKLEATYRDYSNIILQIGPNKGMEMKINIPEINSKTLGLNVMSYLPYFESADSIKTCDNAISIVSNVRSQLGAYQNRLEYATTSIDVTSENMSSALSRIADTDMAREMSLYAQQNVISQAGMSILAQANQRAQQILQLVSR